MALATQCPHCHTTFRVAHDQLKLRAGLVRCGACKQIFNGIENLLRPDQQPGTPAATSPEAVPAAIPRTASPEPDTGIASGSASGGTLPASPDFSDEQASPPLSAVPKNDATSNEGVDFHLPDEYADERTTEEAAGDESTDDAPSGNEVAPDATAPFAADPAISTEPTAQQVAEDPMLRMTLLDFGDNDTQAGYALADQPDPLDQVIADLERKPLRGSKPRPGTEPDSFAENEESGNETEGDENEDDEEPSFVRLGRRRQRRSRAMRTTMAAASLLLLVVLLAQGAYVLRDQLAAHFPQVKPLLLEACAYLDCQVGLPAQIEAVSIESNELQTLTPDSNTLVLTVLLRNRGTVAQTWPHLELSLNDAGEKALVRRVFAPAEYLPRELSPRLGFPAQSEQPVRLFFELDTVKASGYQVYLFYP